MLTKKISLFGIGANKMPNKQVKLIRSRSLGQPKAVLRTFLVATYLSRYIV